MKKFAFLIVVTLLFLYPVFNDAMAAERKTRMTTLGVLIFDDFEMLDVAGPVEMFGRVPQIRIITLAQKKGAVRSHQGVSILAEADLAHAPPLDILLIPGGMGTRKEVNNAKLLDWIQQTAKQTPLVLSVCTGAALLAKTGLLDGKKATSNKITLDWVMSQSHRVNWQKKARWVEDGKIVTSSGIAAGIDMSLYIIGKYYGDTVRDQVAREAEYIFNADPANDPFSQE